MLVTRTLAHPPWFQVSASVPVGVGGVGEMNSKHHQLQAHFITSPTLSAQAHLESSPRRHLILPPKLKKLTMEFVVVIDGLDQLLPRTTAQQLHLGNRHARVGDLHLLVPRVAALEAKLERAGADRALHGLPLDLPATITPPLQVQIPVLALWALVTHKARLPAAADGVAACTAAGTAEPHAQPADGGAGVLRCVDGEWCAWVVSAEPVEMERAVAKPPVSEAVVSSFPRKLGTERICRRQGHVEGD